MKLYLVKYMTYGESKHRRLYNRILNQINHMLKEMINKQVYNIIIAKMKKYIKTANESTSIYIE